jgi:hypothetical protein
VVTYMFYAVTPENGNFKFINQEI